MSKLLYTLLEPYQKTIEQALLEKTTFFESKSKLQEAISYALLQKGKRFRPALVLMIVNALSGSYSALDAALSIEYFHTASLIADDLPCMDNDSERRGKPALHLVYGESVALLASYALIAEGYLLIAQNAKEIPFGEKIGLLALENASYNTGLLGASGGQFLDLFPPQLDLKTYMETVIKKTVALFEISFVFGWLFGGGKQEKIPLIKKAAYHYGMAFQIADDFDDWKEDSKNERLMNALSLLGNEKAYQMFQDELKNYSACLKELNIDSKELNLLGDVLLEIVEKKNV